MSATKSAVDRHNRMVREEMEQAEAVRSDQGSGADFWKPNARRFRPVEEEDTVVNVLAGLAGPESRVIDVGAGGGRITIPLARRVREVVAVEPSGAMRNVLESEIELRNANNLKIIPERWEDADVEPAELVFASHVTYGIQNIEPFLRKLGGMATRHAAVVIFADPPQHALAPFWLAVYGEARLRLPCRDDVLDVLRELGATPRLIALPPQTPMSLGPPDVAFEELRRRLFIGAGTAQEFRLRGAMSTLTVERDGELWLSERAENERSLISWEPSSMQDRQVRTRSTGV